MIKNEFLYEGFHKIEEIESEMKGNKVLREKLHLPSAVGALVIDEDNRVGLVTQYRPTVDKFTKEIPAGILDKGKTKRQTLMEELEEECEIKKEDVLYFAKEPFNHYYMVTGSSDAEMSIYTVRVKRQEDKEVKEDNDVEAVEWVSLEEFKKYIDEAKAVGAKEMLAYNQAVIELSK